MTYREFEDLIPRRQRAKLPTASRIGGALWKHYDLNKHIEGQDGDPKNTPLLILNRYANWDYVAEMMFSDIAVTLEAVNSYVATAWFPASLQGYLTIEQSNKGEALTIATENLNIQSSAIDSLFLHNLQGEKTGVVVVGTFECIPRKIGEHTISDKGTIAFGALSLISYDDDKNHINEVLSNHKELYRYVKNY